MLLPVVSVVLFSYILAVNGQQDYALCGDCHCINGDETCPTGSDVPPTEFSAQLVPFLRSMEPTNPYELACDPYIGQNCDTSPPQILTDLGDSAVCGVRYEETGGLECPTSYGIYTYTSMDELEANGAVLTHYGSCGVCSTLQDLAVYIDVVDLVSKATECTLRTFLSFEDGVNCYQEVGYSEQCAKIWAYNGLQTIRECGFLCTPYRFLDLPNNGPPPDCQLNDCLQCDEDESGPLFAKVAGRTRRRTGLLSQIIRPCDSVLLMNYTVPCEFNLNGTKPPTQSPPEPGILSFVSSILAALFQALIGILVSILSIFGF